MKIVSMRFGSHLYGTSTPASDIDLKSVFVPPARDILLQRAKGSVSTKRAKVEGEKNFAGEIDEESYSLQHYLGLLAEGQTVALDMLFAPESALVEPPTRIWREIVANRRRLLTKKSSAFLGYCRQQANKYGIKGSRVAAARKALSLMDWWLETYSPSMKLGDFSYAIGRAVESTEHMSIEPIVQGDGRSVVQHWEVCGRKLQYTASIGHARNVMKSLVDEYGHRALQAESQQGVDWKALSHAVRVGHQAIELLRTGNVTFPLPNAAHILAIKTAKFPYQEVSAEIEHLLTAVEEAAAASTLPEKPDVQWIDEFVATAYGEAVITGEDWKWLEASTG